MRDKNHLPIASYNCVIQLHTITQLHHKITSSILQRNALDKMYLTWVFDEVFLLNEFYKMSLIN